MLLIVITKVEAKELKAFDPYVNKKNLNHRQKMMALKNFGLLLAYNKLNGCEISMNGMRRANQLNNLKIYSEALNQKFLLIALDRDRKQKEAQFADTETISE